MSELSAWLGGTFDPIHLGHLNCARDLAAVTGLNKITLLPNNVPPHRPQPEATAEQRLAMLKLAIAGDKLFDIDTRELERDQPSWTITTLQELRDTLGQQKPLAFIIGQDSLLSLNQWHQWQQIPELCHLLVCQRPGYSRRHPEAKMQAWIERHLVSTAQALHQAPAGAIFLADTSFYSISATDIRRRNRLGVACDDLLPAAVNRYIRQTGLYRD